MSVKNWNFFYKKEDISVKEKIVDTISLWSAIGLLWYAFYRIVEEHFSAFFEVQAATSETALFAVGMDWKMLALWTAILWLSYDFPEKYIKRGSLFLHGTALALPLGYALFYYEEIVGGVLALIEIYLPYVNEYYQTEYEIIGSVKECMPQACTFVLMVWWLFCWLLAYGSKKKVLLAVFPALALGLALAVGLSPIGDGLFAWVMAAFLLLSLGGSAVLPKLLLLAGTAVSFLAAEILFAEQIEHLASKEQKQAVLDWQEELQNKNPLEAFLPDVFQNREVLKNEAPEYTGKIVLEITADRSPNDSIYLRGFYGSEYRDGMWICEKSAFADACKEAKIAQENAAQRLFQLTYAQADAYYTSRFTYVAMTDYTIRYPGKMGDVAYVPYASDYQSLDEKYDFLGDYLLKKAFWDNTVEVEAVAPELLSEDVLRKISHALEEGKTDTQPVMEWYHTLALEYLQVPEDMTAIAEEAKHLEEWYSRVDVTYEDIREQEAVTDDFWLDAWSSSSYMENADEGIAKTNDFRLEMASLVTKYLGKQMSYSLDLDELPAGTDPVEYALLESGEGYCMHFASAGTLLLRKLGVPARYVSGYVVKPNDFRPADGGFTAEVTDYASHAWVEIYLDDIGWIPIEVTPGYGSAYEKFPTQENILESEQDSESQSQETEDMRKETEEVMESESETLQTEPAETETATEEISSTESEEDGGGDTDGSGYAGSDLSGSGNGFLWKTAAGLTILCGILFLLIGGLRFWKRKYDALLEDEIKKEYPRKAVKRMNRRIYRQLRLTRPNRMFRRGTCSDAAYEEALMEVFSGVSAEDWHRYMEIVKKMHYSVEAVSAEEMMHCYKCYKNVDSLNKFLTKK